MIAIGIQIQSASGVGSGMVSPVVAVHRVGEQFPVLPPMPASTQQPAACPTLAHTPLEPLA